MTITSPRSRGKVAANRVSLLLKRLWKYLKGRFFRLYGMRDTQADHDKPRMSIKQDRSARRRIARKRRYDRRVSMRLDARSEVG